MNYYLFLPISALITNTLLISYVFARRFRSAVIRDFLRFVFFLNLWQICFILYWGMLPPEWMTAIFKLTCFTWLPVGLLLLETVYRFLNIRSTIALPFFRFFVLATILLTASTDLVIKGSVLYDWGYELLPGILFVPLSTIAVSFPAIWGLVLLIRERSKTRQKKIKIQLNLWIAGSSFALAISAYTELFNLDEQGRYLFVPLTPISITIQAIFIFVAITRYGFLNISLERIAVELFRDIHDGIVLTKENHEFFFANQAAISILDGSPSKDGFFRPEEYFGGYREDQDHFPRDYQLSKKTVPQFVELTLSEIKITDEESGILYLLRDITERKASQEKIHQLYSQIVNDLEIARVTQASIITQKFPDKDSYKIHSFFQPIDKVGGDMLRVIEHDSDRVDILFADVSGHGIASAMVGGMLSIAFQIVSDKLLSPAESLSEIHDMLSKVVLHHHISAVYASFYPKESRVKFSYAGHHPILILRNGSVLPLEGEGRILLAIKELHLNDYSFDLTHSDRLLFYSDGLYEVKNQLGEILGYEEFLSWISTMADQDTRFLLEAAHKRALDFGNGKHNDDLAMLALEIGSE
ncbi:serine/threonine protein phosphatase [Leptospira semungkisensis]|uniref:Serine/threonine protein phosphatase n=1 Tax=Leptospira semungkisensis TaxID=2484985 RepID=A0A4R9G7X7_9LEPT|nr:SpoIIE family protein phosphatase [Leptospira semungkisensis]TGK07664.1 serine/threonine protein phosphatase [Leptospira semungkisensis]